MATAAANLAAAQASIAESAANVAARLAELDAAPLADRSAKLNYSEGGVMYNWNDYRASLLAQLDSLGKRIEEMAIAAQIINGPFTVIGSAMDGQYG